MAWLIRPHGPYRSLATPAMCRPYIAAHSRRRRRAGHATARCLQCVPNDRRSRRRRRATMCLVLEGLVVACAFVSVIVAWESIRNFRNFSPCTQGTLTREIYKFVSSQNSYQPWSYNRYSTVEASTSLEHKFSLKCRQVKNSAGSFASTTAVIWFPLVCLELSIVFCVKSLSCKNGMHEINSDGLLHASNSPGILGVRFHAPSMSWHVIFSVKVQQKVPVPLSFQ